MPRKARKRAESGIYHAMLRGIDRQQIFEDAEDYLRFLDILFECRELCGFKIYAYCLMGNHVHLLIKVCHDNLEEIFKRIAGKYVYWYNVKYRRVGHLFQDRFKSEPVEDNSYFLTVLRYIHQNPVKAKLCKKVGDYPYSSYNEYLNENAQIDTDFALQILPREDFAQYNDAVNSDICLEVSSAERRAVTDTQAKEIITKVSHCFTLVEFQELEEKKKTRFLQKIHDKGVSVRQLSRLTGISKGLVEKWLKN